MLVQYGKVFVIFLAGAMIRALEETIDQSPLLFKRITPVKMSRILFSLNRRLYNTSEFNFSSSSLKLKIHCCENPFSFFCMIFLLKANCVISVLNTPFLYFFLK